MKPRVLILDDDRASAIAIGRYLEFAGHEVAVASAVDEALAAAEKLVPEVLICDWKLGEDRDGVDAARLLDDRYGLVIIFVTAHTLESLKQNLVDLKPAKCLRKPVVLAELMHAIGLATSAAAI